MWVKSTAKNGCAVTLARYIFFNIASGACMQSKAAAASTVGIQFAVNAADNQTNT